MQCKYPEAPSLRISAYNFCSREMAGRAVGEVGSWHTGVRTDLSFRGPLWGYNPLFLVIKPPLSAMTVDGVSSRITRCFQAHSFHLADQCQIVIINHLFSAVAHKPS